jgi:hypothetical protein
VFREGIVAFRVPEHLERSEKPGEHDAGEPEGLEFGASSECSMLEWPKTMLPGND